MSETENDVGGPSYGGERGGGSGGAEGGQGGKRPDESSREHRDGEQLDDTVDVGGRGPTETERRG